jgi:beta-lactam-binding protein with PASTA domain
MALRTHVWSVGKLFLLGGALIATYLIFAAASMRMALRAGEVQVPDLTNRTANEATGAAADLGLTIRVDETRRPDQKIPTDRVVAQEPSAGSTARRQRSVRVWLSAGSRATVIPVLIGETERAAQLRLAQAGLELAGVSEIRSQAYPSEAVIAQASGAGPGAGVSLLVNRGERGASYVMPDLIGVSGDRAAKILRDQGFRVAVVGSMPYPGVTSDVVLRQSPQAGFQITPGEPISLEVSR